jgi:DNA processing protein
VPGSLLDPRAAGTNNLLKQGATLITEACDSWRPWRRSSDARRNLPQSSFPPRTSPRRHRPYPCIAQTERTIIINVLGPSPVDIDELIRATDVETRKVHIALLELDLAGRLQRHGRQLVSLIDS